MSATVKPMELNQALTLAGLVIDFELESAPPEATAWRHELNAARIALKKARKRPPAGEFFLSGDSRRTGRPSKGR